MRLIDLVRPQLDGVDAVVEVIAPDLDLRPFLSELEGVRYLRYRPDAWESEEPPQITDGTLVVMAVGPDGSRQFPLAAARRVLEHIGPAGRGLMLFGYAGAELPYHQVIDALTTQRCQVLHAATLDYLHLRCGIAFSRPGELQAPRDYAGQPVSVSDAAAADSRTPAESSQVALRIANEYVLADFVSRGLRAHLLDLERLAGAAAFDRGTTAGLTSKNERLARDLEEAQRQLSRADARVAAIERSATWEVGRMLVSAARNPRRGMRVPRQLYRLWQQRGASARAGTNGAAAAAGPGQPRGDNRAASPAPAAGRAGEAAWGAADGLLAAFTPPGAMQAAAVGQLVIAGVLTARSCATLDGDAVVHPLMPHNAALVLERTAADLVLIEAAALLPGNAWSYAGDPAAADSGRLLAALIGLARALDKPVVLLRNVAPSRLPELGRLASRCDAVTDEGLGVQLARFNPVDLPMDRPCDPVYYGTRSPRERPAQRRLLDELTAGPDAPVRLVADGSWRDAPAVYRRHGLFVAASAAQAREQLACGARVIGPLAPAGGAAPDADRIRGEIDMARDRGPCGPAGIRDVLRGLFQEHATPVRLVDLARLAGLPTGPAGSREIAVVAQLTGSADAGEVSRLASAVLRQRHRPSEVVVSWPAGSAGTALTERAVAAELAELTASGVAVRTARASGAAVAARAARAAWVAPWESAREYPDTHLLDLACARECSRADAVGYSPGDGYVFSAKIEPALARRELLAAAGSTGGSASSSDSWARRGVALFALPS
jgi:hypothetical protein